MKHPLLPLLLFWICSPSFAPLRAVAQAQEQQRAESRNKTAVVLPFSGPASALARKGVLAALAAHADLVEADAFSQAASDMNANMGSAEGLVTVCTQLKVDAVITGQVTAKGKGRLRVVITMMDGGSGEVVGRRAAMVHGKRKVFSAGQAIGAKISPLLQKTSHADQEPIRVEEEPIKPARQQRQPADGAGEKRGPAGLGGLFELSFGLGFSRRDYSLTGDDPGKDRRYDGGLFPEFTLHLDLFPAAPFASHWALRNLGIGLDYSRHLSISTTMKDSSGQDVEVDTGSQQLLLDLMFRWPILSSATTPVVKVSLGWGFREFELGDNRVLPTFNYQFVRIGLDGHIPITTQLIALKAGVDVRPIIAVGQQALDALGAKSGPLGFAVRGGLGGKLDLGLFYGAMFEYLHYSMDFAGRTEYAGKPVPADAPLSLRTEPASGSDGFIRVWFLVGYAI